MNWISDYCSEEKIYVFIYLPGDTVAVPAGIFIHYLDDGYKSKRSNRRVRYSDMHVLRR